MIPQSAAKCKWPGRITCAETIDEGDVMIEDAKRCWLEACLEDGFPIPEPAISETYQTAS